jgi:hypothetical protein
MSQKVTNWLAAEVDLLQNDRQVFEAMLAKTSWTLVWTWKTLPGAAA